MSSWRCGSPCFPALSARQTNTFAPICNIIHNILGLIHKACVYTYLILHCVYAKIHSKKNFFDMEKCFVPRQSPRRHHSALFLRVMQIFLKISVTFEACHSKFKDLDIDWWYFKCKLHELHIIYKAENWNQSAVHKCNIFFVIYWYICDLYIPRLKESIHTFSVYAGMCVLCGCVCVCVCVCVWGLPKILNTPQKMCSCAPGCRAIAHTVCTV